LSGFFAVLALLCNFLVHAKKLRAWEIHRSAVRRNDKRDKSQELDCCNVGRPRRSSQLLTIRCEGEAVIGVQVDIVTNQMRYVNPAQTIILKCD
jgi:hypothetical protein